MRNRPGQLGVKNVEADFSEESLFERLTNRFWDFVVGDASPWLDVDSDDENDYSETWKEVASDDEDDHSDTWKEVVPLGALDDQSFSTAIISGLAEQVALLGMDDSGHTQLLQIDVNTLTTDDQIDLVLATIRRWVAESQLVRCMVVPTSYVAGEQLRLWAAATPEERDHFHRPMLQSQEKTSPVMSKKEAAQAVRAIRMIDRGLTRSSSDEIAPKEETREEHLSKKMPTGGLFPKGFKTNQSEKGQTMKKTTTSKPETKAPVEAAPEGSVLLKVKINEAWSLLRKLDEIKDNFGKEKGDIIKKIGNFERTQESLRVLLKEIGTAHKDSAINDAMDRIRSKMSVLVKAKDALASKHKKPSGVSLPEVRRVADAVVAQLAVLSDEQVSELVDARRSQMDVAQSLAQLENVDAPLAIEAPVGSRAVAISASELMMVRQAGVRAMVTHELLSAHSVERIAQGDATHLAVCSEDEEGHAVVSLVEVGRLLNNADLLSHVLFQGLNTRGPIVVRLVSPTQGAAMQFLAGEQRLNGLTQAQFVGLTDGVMHAFGSVAQNRIAPASMGQVLAGLSQADVSRGLLTIRSMADQLQSTPTAPQLDPKSIRIALQRLYLAVDFSLLAVTNKAFKTQLLMLTTQPMPAPRGIIKATPSRVASSSAPAYSLFERATAIPPVVSDTIPTITGRKKTTRVVSRSADPVLDIRSLLHKKQQDEADLARVLNAVAKAPVDDAPLGAHVSPLIEEVTTRDVAQIGTGHFSHLSLLGQAPDGMRVATTIDLGLLRTPVGVENVRRMLLEQSRRDSIRWLGVFTSNDEATSLLRLMNKLDGLTLDAPKQKANTAPVSPVQATQIVTAATSLVSQLNREGRKQMESKSEESKKAPKQKKYEEATKKRFADAAIERELGKLCAQVCRLAEHVPSDGIERYNDALKALKVFRKTNKLTVIPTQMERDLQTASVLVVGFTEQQKKARPSNAHRAQQAVKTAAKAVAGLSDEEVLSQLLSGMTPQGLRAPAVQSMLGATTTTTAPMSLSPSVTRDVGALMRRLGGSGSDNHTLGAAIAHAHQGVVARLVEGGLSRRDAETQANQSTTQLVRLLEQATNGANGFVYFSFVDQRGARQLISLSLRELLSNSLQSQQSLARLLEAQLDGGSRGALLVGVASPMQLAMIQYVHGRQMGQIAMPDLIGAIMGMSAQEQARLTMGDLNALVRAHGGQLAVRNQQTLEMIQAQAQALEASLLPEGQRAVQPDELVNFMRLLLTYGAAHNQLFSPALGRAPRLDGAASSPFLHLITGSSPSREGGLVINSGMGRGAGATGAPPPPRKTRDRDTLIVCGPGVSFSPPSKKARVDVGTTGGTGAPLPPPPPKKTGVGVVGTTGAPLPPPKEKGTKHVHFEDDVVATPSNKGPVDVKALLIKFDALVSDLSRLGLKNKDIMSSSNDLCKLSAQFKASQTQTGFATFHKGVIEQVDHLQKTFSHEPGVWRNLHPILKGLLGVLAALTVIPALCIEGAKQLGYSKSGYIATFFKPMPESDLFVTGKTLLSGIKEETGKVVDEVTKKDAFKP